MDEFFENRTEDVAFIFQTKIASAQCCCSMYNMYTASCLHHLQILFVCVVADTATANKHCTAPYAPFPSHFIYILCLNTMRRCCLRFVFCRRPLLLAASLQRLSCRARLVNIRIRSCPLFHSSAKLNFCYIHFITLICFIILKPKRRRKKHLYCLASKFRQVGLST